MSREEKELRKSASRMPSGFASDDAELNDVRSRRKLVKKRPQSSDVDRTPTRPLAIES